MALQFSKKALSSVVSVVLLLSIMLIATFTTFNFYKSLSSSYKVDIEDQIALDTYINFIFIESNTLFYTNTYTYPIVIDNLTLIGEDCSYSTTLETGDNNLSLSGCTISTSDLSIQVLIKSNGVVYSEFVLYKDNY